jgi:excisionase family DNA binding protein
MVTPTAPADLLTEREKARLLAQLFVTPAQAARLLSISRSSIYRMIRNEDIPVKRYRGGARIPVGWIREQAGIP